MVNFFVTTNRRHVVGDQGRAVPLPIITSTGMGAHNYRGLERHIHACGRQPLALEV